MQIAVARLAPIVKLYAQFETGLGVTHKIVFIKTKIFIDIVDLRYGRLTHTDAADLIGFNQVNIKI